MHKKDTHCRKITCFTVAYWRRCSAACIICHECHCTQINPPGKACLQEAIQVVLRFSFVLQSILCHLCVICVAVIHCNCLFICARQFVYMHSLYVHKHPQNRIKICPK